MKYTDRRFERPNLTEVPAAAFEVVRGNIQCTDIEISPMQKEKIEKEVHDWIFAHAYPEVNNGVNYWVVFSRADFDGKVRCEVQIQGGITGSVWQSSDISSQPVRAFNNCIRELSPALLNVG